MTISINKDLCIGCGACVSTCPNNFAMGEDAKAKVISQENSSCLNSAIENCPVQAIKNE